MRLFNDDDQAVRQEAAPSFRHLENGTLGDYADLIGAFCDSKAFQDDSFSILHVLEQSLRRLPGMTCIVCEKFLERFNRPEPISIARCRELLGEEADSMTDHEVALIRRHAETMAWIVVEMYREHRQISE